MASLRALVADLSSRAQGTTVGGRAIARDVTKLPACVALHSLSLAIAGEMIRPTALVASGSARVTAIPTTETTIESPTRRTCATGSTRSRSGAVTSKVARLAAVVATTVRAVEAQRGTIRLNVAETLAVVALLGFGGTRTRAAAGFVSRLLAVVAKALRGRADLSVVANVATLVACTSREQHIVCITSLPNTN